MSRPVYLDYNATTPVAPEVAAAIRPFLHEDFGNPSSSHPIGQQARAAVRQSRQQVATLINAAPDEIVFTGCATEANNLALLGVAAKAPAGRRHLVVSAVEHPAVMQPALHLQRHGWQLSIVPVDARGRVAPSAVAAVLRPDTALVSVMHANNEVGTIQPVGEIAALTRPRGILLHTDAAQSAGKIGVDVEALGVDLLTLAGHKCYATKGVGALYVRSGTPIGGIMFGADQEHGLRPGTRNAPAIVGFGVAARLARERLPEATAHLRRLRDGLHTLLAGAIPWPRAERRPGRPIAQHAARLVSWRQRARMLLAGCRQPWWRHRSARPVTPSTTPSAACSRRWAIDRRARRGGRAAVGGPDDDRGGHRPCRRRPDRRLEAAGQAMPRADATNQVGGGLGNDFDHLGAGRHRDARSREPAQPSGDRRGEDRRRRCARPPLPADTASPMPIAVTKTPAAGAYTIAFASDAVDRLGLSRQGQRPARR